MSSDGCSLRVWKLSGGVIADGFDGPLRSQRQKGCVVADGDELKTHRGHARRIVGAQVLDSRDKPARLRMAQELAVDVEDFGFLTVERRRQPQREGEVRR